MISIQKLRDMNLHAVADELEQLRAKLEDAERTNNIQHSLMVSAEKRGVDKAKEECEELHAKLAAMESELSSLPAKWSEDSSLKTWFPITSDELESLREEVSELRAYKEAVEKQEPVIRISGGRVVDFNPNYVGSVSEGAFYSKPVPAEQPAVTVPDGFREIAEAVAHIGVDFGYGNFALSQEHIEKARALLEAAPSHSQQSVHPDDIAVDQFADVMKHKLAKARDKGRSGWENPSLCKVSDLAAMLVDHLPKGDPVDVANFAMMLFFREGGNDALKDVCKFINSQQSAETVPAEAYAQAAAAINSIYGASQHCDCLSFEIAHQWRNETHGGTIYDRCPSHESEQGGNDV